MFQQSDAGSEVDPAGISSGPGLNSLRENLLRKAMASGHSRDPPVDDTGGIQCSFFTVYFSLLTNLQFFHMKLSFFFR